MNINKTPSSIHAKSQDRPLFERDIDAYKAKDKLTEPAVCPECNSVFHEGRWQWMTVPVFANREICPACHRINDNEPAGYVMLDGPFFNDHREEIKLLIQHHVEHERNEHPLKCIIAIHSEGDGIIVTTTETHLASGIGEAIYQAYQGKLKVSHVSGENLVRVHWSH
ncbi:BCAM0308 family protein [Methylotenera sp.]|uniref:BCAM0308 family protein n=1 Tax=Methylotenera sp. TaxID=2051956 RepID=UPI00248A43CD|nr:BCAM0308 family protein [Methylotenera sp.]MDI1361790.1 BCAM0308 family protein [Methylotenera sp.]